MEFRKNLLLIGGTKQNVGKTTFTCKIIERFSPEFKIVAIKTSNHFHGILDTDIVIENNNKFTIVKETVTNTGKDSARMLASGASDVFFIQCIDKYIDEAFYYIEKEFDDEIFIICESASLRSYIKPAVFIALKSDIYEPIPSNKINLNLADIFISDYLSKVENIDTFVDLGPKGWLTTKKTL